MAPHTPRSHLANVALLETPFKHTKSKEELDLALAAERQRSEARLKSSWESIFDKYGENCTVVADEIDNETGEVVVDNGHWKGLKDLSEESDEEEAEDEGKEEAGITDVSAPSIKAVAESKRQKRKAEPVSQSKADRVGKGVKRKLSEMDLEPDGCDHCRYKDELADSGPCEHCKGRKADFANALQKRSLTNDKAAVLSIRSSPTHKNLLAPAAARPRRSSETSTPTQMGSPKVARMQQHRKPAQKTAQPLHSLPKPSNPPLIKTQKKANASSRRVREASSHSDSNAWAAPLPEDDPFYDPTWQDEHPDGTPFKFPSRPQNPPKSMFVTPQASKRVRKSLNSTQVSSSKKTGKSDNTVKGTPKLKPLKDSVRNTPGWTQSPWTQPRARKGLGMLDFLDQLEKRAEKKANVEGVSEVSDMKVDANISGDKGELDPQLPPNSTSEPAHVSEERNISPAEPLELPAPGVPPDIASAPTALHNVPSLSNSASPERDPQSSSSVYDIYEFQPTPESTPEPPNTARRQLNGSARRRGSYITPGRRVCGSDGYKCGRNFCFECFGIEDG